MFSKPTLIKISIFVAIAGSLFFVFRNVGINSRLQCATLINAAKIYIELGEKDHWRAALLKAEKKVNERPISSMMSDTSLVRIAVAYSRAGEKNKATELLNKLFTTLGKQRGRLIGYERLVAAEEFIEEGQYDEALEIVDRIPLQGQNVVMKARALADLALAYAKIGNKDKAMTTLSAAIEAHKASQGWDVEDVSRKIAAVRVELEQYDKALQMARSSDYAGGSESQVAVRYFEEGQEDKAKALLDESLVRAKDLVRRDSLEYARMSQPSRGTILSGTVKQVIDIAIAYAKIGDKNKAAEILSGLFTEAKAHGYGDNILADIASGFVDLSQCDKALEIAAVISKSEYLMDKPATLVKIAEKYEEQGEREKANALLSQATSLAKQMVDTKGSMKPTLFSMISGAYIKSGQQDKAFQLDKEKGYIHLGFFESDVTLGVVALKYAKNRQYDQAVRIVNRIYNKDERESYFMHVGLEQVKVEKKIDGRVRKVLDRLIK